MAAALSGAVKHFTHTVQPLKFIVASLSQGQNPSDRMSVVRGELTVKLFPVCEDFARAIEVGQVSIFFAGINREASQAFYLGMFNFCIPIGALNQTHGKLCLVLPRKLHQPIEHVRRTLGIRLHDKTYVATTVHSNQCFEHFQGELQSICLFGINGDGYLAFLSTLTEFSNNGNKFVTHSLELCRFIPRMQGRKLNGNRRIVAATSNHFDGVQVALVVAPRGVGISCRLTQHVE